MTDSLNGITWKESGDANVYTLMKAGNWFGMLRLNGEMTVTRQRLILRRIVACVNACEGLPTELIENHGVTRSGIAKGTEILEQQLIQAERRAINNSMEGRFVAIAKHRLDPGLFQEMMAEAKASADRMHLILEQIGK